MKSDSEKQLPPSDRTDADDQPSKAAPVSAGNGNAVAAMNDGRYKIPGDVVNKATADLPDNQRSAIRRLHAYYHDNALSLGELDRLTSISSATLTQIFRGKYPSKLDGIVPRIEAFFRQEVAAARLRDSRKNISEMPFIETSLTDKMWRVCDLTRQHQKISYFFGESHIGKTRNLKEYTLEHNHGNTIYTSMPTGGALRHYLAALAGALRISAHQRDAELRMRLIGAFHEEMQLIVDEAHNCIPARTSSSARSLQTIEFIRELFDKARCSVIISATNVFRDALRQENIANLMKQTQRRRLFAVQLPDRPSQADLNLFAAHYKLPASSGEARELEKRVIAEEALGMWLTVLRMAAELAAKNHVALSWGHVITADRGRRQIEAS